MGLPTSAAYISVPSQPRESEAPNASGDEEANNSEQIHNRGWFGNFRVSKRTLVVASCIGLSLFVPAAYCAGKYAGTWAAGVGADALKGNALNGTALNDTTSGLLPDLLGVSVGATAALYAGLVVIIPVVVALCIYDRCVRPVDLTARIPVSFPQESVPLRPDSTKQLSVIEEEAEDTV